MTPPTPPTERRCSHESPDGISGISGTYGFDYKQLLLEDLQGLFRRLRARHSRTIREFAEQELYIPSGPFKGRRFKADRQPFTRHALDLLSTGKWKRVACTGPSQSGKTLLFFVLIILYYLFEREETVIVAVPDFDMAGDKWRHDILPVILASRFKTLLPKVGVGARGGKVKSITFSNGVTIRFMSALGGDKSRAGFTGRIVVATETDGMDTSNTSSKEADPITQIEARTRSFGDDALIFLECTVSIEQGRIWREYHDRSTRTKFYLKCPHCTLYSHPTREHFTGWQEAETIVEARKSARFTCPECAAPWTEEDRHQANRDMIYVMKGETFNKETQEVEGTPDETDTLGIRWDPFNNMFVPASMVGADEWECENAPPGKKEDLDKKLHQFVWTIPHVPQDMLIDLTPLSIRKIVAKTDFKVPRFKVPKGFDRIVMGVDLGSRILNWTLIAVRLNGAAAHIMAYGEEMVPEFESIELSVLTALRNLRDSFSKPFSSIDPEDKNPYHLSQVFIDARWQSDVVHLFHRESGKVWIPAMGLSRKGQGQSYRAPKSTKNKDLAFIGAGYHISCNRAKGILECKIDSNYWKTYLHNRFLAPTEDSGTLTMHAPITALEHHRFAKQILAEKKISEFDPKGKGEIIRWIQKSRANHFLDSTYLGLGAGHMVGARLLAPVAKLSPSKISQKQREPRKWIHKVEKERSWA